MYGARVVYHVLDHAYAQSASLQGSVDRPGKMVCQMHALNLPVKCFWKVLLTRHREALWFVFHRNLHKLNLDPCSIICIALY